MHTEVIESCNEIKSNKVPHADQSSYNFLDQGNRIAVLLGYRIQPSVIDVKSKTTTLL